MIFYAFVRRNKIDATFVSDARTQDPRLEFGIHLSYDTHTHTHTHTPRAKPMYPAVPC